MSHKVSRTLVDDLHARLFVFEDLRTKNMTRLAKGSIDRPGRNVCQKAGLNRAILHSAWSRIHQFTRCKARRGCRPGAYLRAIDHSQKGVLKGPSHLSGRLG
jgi:putative transposase